MKVHNLAFGRVLRALRLEYHLTQADLAFSSSLDRTYISLLELGARSPTLDTIVVLCDALNVSLSSLADSVEEAMNKDRSWSEN